MIGYLPKEGRQVQISDLPQHAVVALGVFDGVHRGHQALLARARALADELELPLLVLTFRTVRKEGGLLTTPEMRVRLLAQAGADVAVFYDFEELRHLTPEAFVRHILLDRHGCRGAVCGTDYRFGQGRAGDAAALSALLAPYPVLVAPPVCTADGVQISSTRVRDALSRGDMETASALLGYHYTLCGQVRHGRGFGHKLGSPTANISLDTGLLLPRYGVYVTAVTVDGNRYPAVTNIGRNPTVVTDGEPTCESYLLAGGGDLYGKELAVSFLLHLRDEQQFADATALREQIARDTAATRAWFADHPLG